MAGHDISQTASLPSIAAGSNYTGAHQAYIMVLAFVIVVLVAAFSDLLKKRYQRYLVSAKDLGGYVDEKLEEHEKERAKVESRSLFQPLLQGHYWWSSLSHSKGL
jgi:ABC-type transport system involved in cytochrome bd biosynthesis fused ATPase/permease subunit